MGAAAAGVALLARGAFVVLAVYIVGHGVVQSFQAGDPGMAVAKVVLFPLTYFVYPWTAGLGVLFVVSLLAYVVSTLGGLSPVD